MAVVQLEGALGSVIDQHAMGLCRGCGWFGAVGSPCGCGTGRRISALRGARAEAQAQAASALVAEAARRVAARPNLLVEALAHPGAAAMLVGQHLPPHLAPHLAPHLPPHMAPAAPVPTAATPSDPVAAYHPVLSHAYSAALGRLMANPQTTPLVPLARPHLHAPPPRTFASTYGEYSDALSRALSPR
jgi:hypothetical protein